MQRKPCSVHRANRGAIVQKGGPALADPYNQDASAFRTRRT